jgi:two-component system alkaline phosphatase synthesis response regulator PhoP
LHKRDFFDKLSFQKPTMSENLKVLLIEDEKEVAELYRLKLSLDGYDVSVAENGEEGLKKALEDKPELIFLDIKMPGMDGFEVLKHLRADKVTKDTPVVILSNFDEQEMIEKGLTLGANEYLIKSQFTPADLSAKAKTWFSED